MGLYIVTKFQIDTTLLTPSKSALAEVLASASNKNSVTSILFTIRIEVKISNLFYCLCLTAYIQINSSEEMPIF